ncbi:MAG: zinc-ribbon domain-containing protein, partial [Lachnospiraceae bacterium]|nr:zinc-ribbon domain-containing protein [Lachnospiraceae bacterium]
MFCKNCGTQVPDGTKFCPECGAELTSPADNDAGQISGTIQTETIQKTPKRKFSLKWALLIVAVLCVGTAA